MSDNFLITGSPGSGKTTVVENVLSSLRNRGFEVGGVYCPEIRREGVRRGFKIIDIMTGESKILAHVDRDEGPRVSKYCVNVPNVDAVSKSAISRALERADLLVVDEIAPMEVYSDEFKRQVRRALDSEKPLIAVVHKRSKSGFIGGVKRREDSKLFEVTGATRDTLPGRLEELVLESLR